MPNETLPTRSRAQGAPITQGLAVDTRDGIRGAAVAAGDPILPIVITPTTILHNCVTSLHIDSEPFPETVTASGEKKIKEKIQSFPEH